VVVGTVRERGVIQVNRDERGHGYGFPLCATSAGLRATPAHIGRCLRRNLRDFSGTYRGVSRGLTLIEGRMHAKLTNGNGVIMYLAGETEGLASSMGVQVYEVSLTD